MTEGQKDWARQHDWFVSAVLTRNGWTVTVRNDVGPGTMNFDSYKQLREWAGY